MSSRYLLTVVLTAVVGLLPTTTGLLAADAPPAGKDLQTLLSRKILAPDLPLTEVQAYCENRIKLMPEIKSAAEWEKKAAAIREDVLENVVFRGQARAWRDAKCKVEWLDTIDGGPGYKIRKLRYEALPGLWIPALLYEPEKLSGKVPAVLNVNGHDSAGKAASYKQIRCINLAKRGVLALNLEWLGMGQLGGPTYSHARTNQLDLCGTSGVATHYLAMSRAIDLLLAHPNADAERLAVTGLSGGGWQTIFISSLDPRVKLTNPVAGYSSFRTRVHHFSDLGDSEQTPSDLAAHADYAHLTAIMAPRPTLLTFNEKDNCCFASGHAMAPLVDAAEPAFAAFGKHDNLRTHVNSDPGNHNYEKDNRQAFYKMIGDHFFGGSKDYSADEIPSQKEVKTKDALAVELPAENLNFNSLALAAAKELPRKGELPRDRADAEQWQRDRRSRLSALVRFKAYMVEAAKADEETKGDLKATYWRLRMGAEWTVPAVELSRGEPKSTALLVADAGREKSAAVVEKLLAEGHRVVAIDPFYFGESKISKKDWLFAILMASVGDRPLGVQASQVAAAARWSSVAHGAPVTVVAVGPRSSAFALLAAAADPQAVAGLRLHESLGSLKEIIEQSRTVSEIPEMFCFGLLEQFDILQLAALVSPRPVRLVEPSDRAKTELAPLKAWNVLLGGDGDPLAAGDVPDGKILNAKMHHLRWGTNREWDEFAEKAESSDLVVRFESAANATERTLRVRHRDLKQQWTVSLNGKSIAPLPRDEKEMVTFWSIAPGAIKDGANELRVACSAKPPPFAPADGALDDVMIGEIALLNVPRAAALSEAKVEVAVVDANGGTPLPCRITIVDERGCLMSLGNVSDNRLAVRPGIVYSGDGKASLSLPAGKYTIYAGRGFAYSLDSAKLDLRAGQTAKQTLRIRQAVQLDGYVSSDTHVHTFTHSRHGDATIEERMLTLAGEGIELPIATDHNVQIDYEPIARKVGIAAPPSPGTPGEGRGGGSREERKSDGSTPPAKSPLPNPPPEYREREQSAGDREPRFGRGEALPGVRKWFTPLIGNEVTTSIGHFNVFPLPREGKLPDWRAPTWAAVGRNIAEAAGGGDPAIILNHARDVHSKFRPFDPSRHISVTGEDLEGWVLPANAMEVINSGATQTDPLLLFRDWFGMLNRGTFLTPVGSSDSHDVSRYIVGQGRTYIRADGKDPGRIDVAKAVRSFREGRVLVSYGLVADITVNGKFGPGDLVTDAEAGAQKDELEVAVRVLGPEWTRAKHVTLYANGVPIREADIATPAGKPEPAGVKWQTTWRIPRPKHDVWLAVIATGPGVQAPYWLMSKPYQPTSPKWGEGYALGASGAVRVDADGSGKFESAYENAGRIVKGADGDLAKVVTALADYDQATAAQAAGLLRTVSAEGFEAKLRAAAKDAAPATKTGFEQFLAAWAESQAAKAAKPPRPASGG